MNIYYGTTDCSIDVTDFCLEKLEKYGIITIPSNDCVRAQLFTDPLFGIVKKIIIRNNDTQLEYDDKCIIRINIENNTITTTTDDIILDKLANIHSNLKINYGTFYEEFPEQKMAVRYLTGKEKVLEIGGNIGRNTLVIAHILENDANLVSLECDVNTAQQLTENRDINNFSFHIENAALSKRKLIQHVWATIPSNTLLDGYTWVNTITWRELNEKYNIEFDTLILDCEGAFYYILMDMPEILNNIKLIIMENDYHDISHKNYVDEILLKNNFTNQYTEAGGWGVCYYNFFEVWSKL